MVTTFGKKVLVALLFFGMRVRYFLSWFIGSYTDFEILLLLLLFSGKYINNTLV